jgi:hypothetical protein
MAQDTQAWETPNPINAAASGGLIQTALGFVAAAAASGNTVRVSAYGNLTAAAGDFRQVLLNFDPQADSAVLTQITALLALL